ncbi:MAG TPA: UDP-N-acetylmuramoyl-tripeptide--D-alanyl-D-alanine ligase [Gaiellaceae bacterium]
MIPLPADELRGLGELDASADEVTGVRVDSRLVSAGDLFVAVAGGEAYVDDARARGAAATLVPRDGFAALAAIARSVRDRSSARVVGITGSYGKTTTKDVLAAIAGPQARTVAAERSFNNEVGLPLTLCRLEADTEICIVELAMRGFGQIAELAAVARPELGVVVAVGQVHLEKVGSLEGVVRAKSELVAALPPGGTAIVPADFPVDRDDLEVVRLGKDVRVESFEPPHLRTTLGHVEVSFTARHLAVNALCALAAARALGLELPQRLDVEFSDMRNQELELPGGGLLINDAWNANPVSMRAALEHLRDRAAGRRTVAVLGDMAELGAYSEEGHLEVARAAAEVGVDVLVAVGPQARAYGGRWAATLDEAIAVVRAEVRPGDCVLVKGARSMGLEGIAAALTNVAA